MLSIHLRLGLPSGLFPAGFPTNNLYTFLFSPSVYDTYTFSSVVGQKRFGDIQCLHLQDQKL
jgi:hypothetical protein